MAPLFFVTLCLQTDLTASHYQSVTTDSTYTIYRIYTTAAIEVCTISFKNRDDSGYSIPTIANSTLTSTYNILPELIRAYRANQLPEIEVITNLKTLEAYAACKSVIDCAILEKDEEPVLTPALAAIAMEKSLEYTSVYTDQPYQSRLLRWIAAESARSYSHY
jgi:hypothetical protein